MKLLQKRIGNQIKTPMVGVLICCLFLLGCNKYEDLQPKSTFETSTDSLQNFDISLKKEGSTIIRFDSIAQGGTYKISFTPFEHCSLQLIEDGKAIEIKGPAYNWENDFSKYTICKNGNCRTGSIYIKNSDYTNPIFDTIDSNGCIILPLRKFYTFFLTPTLLKNFFPNGVEGRIDTFETKNYTIKRALNNTNPSYTILEFYALPKPESQPWAWDTVSYKLSGTNGKCYSGKIEIIIGDTCKSLAKADSFTVSNGKIIVNQTELTANDFPCAQPAGLHITRSGTEENFNYGNYKVRNTEFGVLTDTLINGQQHYKYVRTKPSARKDKFVYYLKSFNPERVTKAWVYLKLN